VGSALADLPITTGGVSTCCARRPAPRWQSTRGGNLDYSSCVYREGPGRRRPM